MDHYGTVESVEIQNVRILNEKFSKELEFFRHSFNLLAETIIDLSNKLYHTENPHLLRDMVILMVSSKLLLSSKALLNLSLNGYEYEARVLIRTMLEDFLRCECFFNDEETAHKWLQGTLSIEEVKCIVPNLSLNENFKWIYKTLSDYVHTNPSSLGSLIKVSDKSVYVKISPNLPDSTEDQAAIVVPLIGFNIISLEILRNAYEEKIETAIKKRISQLTEQILPYLKKFTA